MTLSDEVLASIERVALGQASADDIDRLKALRAASAEQAAEVDAALREAIAQWAMLERAFEPHLLDPADATVLGAVDDGPADRRPVRWRPSRDTFLGCVLVATLGVIAYGAGLLMTDGRQPFAYSLAGLCVSLSIGLLALRQVLGRALRLPRVGALRQAVTAVVFGGLLGGAWAGAVIPGWRTHFASATARGSIVEFTDQTGRLTNRVEVPGLRGDVQLWFAPGTRPTSPLVLAVQDGAMAKPPDPNDRIVVFDSTGRWLANIPAPNEYRGGSWRADVQVGVAVDGSNDLCVRWHPANWGLQYWTLYRWVPESRGANVTGKLVAVGLGHRLFGLNTAGGGTALVAEGLCNQMSVVRLGMYARDLTFFQSPSKFRGAAPFVPSTESSPVERAPAPYAVIMTLPGWSDAIVGGASGAEVTPDAERGAGDWILLGAEGRLFSFRPDGTLVVDGDRPTMTDHARGFYGPRMAKWLEESLMGGLGGQVLTIAPDDPDPLGTARSFRQRWFESVDEVDKRVQEYRSELRKYQFLDIWDRDVEWMRHYRAELAAHPEDDPLR
jgi:hypothetical protein